MKNLIGKVLIGGLTIILGLNINFSFANNSKFDLNTVEIVKYLKKNGIKSTVRDTNICKGKLRNYNSWTMFDESGKYKIIYRDLGNNCKNNFLSNNKIDFEDELSIVFNNTSYKGKHIEIYLDKSLDGFPEIVDYVSDSGNFSYRGDMPGSFKEKNAKAYLRQRIIDVRDLARNNKLRKKARR